jgi:cell division protein FtsI (penicillin-binding protein 3)
VSAQKNIGIRAYIVFSVICLFAFTVLVKVFMLQAFPDDRALAIAQNFTYKIIEIEPTRGQILSSDGSLLATSVPEYEIRWDSKAPFDEVAYTEKIDSMCRAFSRLLGDKSSLEYKRLFREAKAKGDRYKKIADHLSYNQLQELKQFPFIKAGKAKSGFIFIQKDKRRKPFGQLAARTIGLEREENKVGLELFYNDLLAGKKGQQLQEKIAGGIWKPMTDEFIVDPEPGCDIVATIDVHLQDVAHAALRRQLEEHSAQWGCAVLMEVETGYIKAIANLSLNTENGTYEERLNYAIAQSIEPGSTMKLASLMACLDEGKIELSDSVATGNGITYFYGKPMKDSNWDKGGNGTLSAEEVFEKSSNIGTALLAKKSFEKSPQRFLDKLHEFGLGDPLGVDLPGEGKPFLYASTKEKGWSGLSLTQMSIGYETQATPLQILAFYNAVANNGKMVRPSFVQEIVKNGRVIEKKKPVILREQICSKETLAKCKKMMEGVMEPGGTAEKVFLSSPYRVAGKTGTAWINESGAYVANRYRASFVGYFPANDPKYTCIVVVHDPRSGVYYGSAIAAPVFKELADKIYSTQLEFHVPDQPSDSTELADAKIPVSKNGNRKDLRTVLKALQIPIEDIGNSDWVTTTTKEKSVGLKDAVVAQQKVPNVVGMGLQDALFLLESQGMAVRVMGYGKVRRQSVAPGSAVQSNPYITIELL